MSKLPVLKKMASFTIIEMMITLLISSIVISMGYFAYFLLTAQFSRYRDRAQNAREFSLLATAWRTDFDRSAPIRDTLDHNHILFIRQDTPVLYSIDTRCILRECPGSRDSFPLHAIVQDIRYVDDTLPLIREIQLSIDLNDTHILLPGVRNYSAREIILAQKSLHE